MIASQETEQARKLYKGLEASALAVLGGFTGSLNSPEEAIAHIEYLSNVKRELGIRTERSYE